MTSQLPDGALVEIHGLAGGLLDQEDKAKHDVNGQRAQLVEFDQQAGLWTVMTFDGFIVDVPQKNLRLLEPHQLEGLDIVIGPRSDEGLVPQEMTQALTLKGYCHSALFLSHVVKADVMRAVGELDWDRVPPDFEPYYLGTDSREKTKLVDFEELGESELSSVGALRTADSTIAQLGAQLTPLLNDTLGIEVSSRTNLLVRQTFEDEEEEAKYVGTAMPTEAERLAFMTLVKRRRVCAMHFMGPLEGRLSLVPKGEEGGEEIEVLVRPGSLVLFLTERFHYSFTCFEGITTVLQSWFLCEMPKWDLGNIRGDLEMITGVDVGSKGPQGETVAVKGIGTMLGGDAKDYNCFWIVACKAGADTFVQIPISRFDVNTFCDWEDLGRAQFAGKSYTRHQGFVEGIEMFDEHFFGISRTEAAGMDPNQRKVLEVGYTAVHMAGYSMKDMQRNPPNIGSFVGTSGTEWNMVAHATDVAGCGGHESILSNRLGFALNLKGMSVTVNTACSAGLVAMHMGKLQLKRDIDRLDGSIACGVNLAYSPAVFIGCCAGGMLSYKGRCFTFDTGGDGYGRGEGCSGVFLTREKLSREVFALVAGSQANQDGRSASLTAPNGPAQEKCIMAAFREANIRPPEADIFECHGTGTALGDPIEVGAFRKIYGREEREHSLLVTTSKTNLGHLEGGAGMAGFIKCSLQVARAEACPNLHLRQLNAHLDISGFPAQLLSEGQTCAYDSSYSGVSSFGFGGTNSHAIAYGRNMITSRGAAQQDHMRAVANKIQHAAPPQILAESADPEEWETTGMPCGEEWRGKDFAVEVTSTGKAIWREIVQLPLEMPGSALYVSGTFNTWGMDLMTADADVRGLYTVEVELGSSGQELFHVCVDEDVKFVYHPKKSQCTRKSDPVLGPQQPPGDRKEACWKISGEAGWRYRVELLRTDRATNISWIRLKH